LKGISIVLPALNEEGNVEHAVDRAGEAATRFAEHVEVIVVDDGSTDGTADAARRAGARVVSHERNRGYGAALRSGFAAATEPWIFQMDCDNQFDPEELEKLVRLTCNAHIIVGIRVARADNWKRRWAGRAWNQLCRLTFGYLARDIDCGFKLLDRAAITRLDLGSDGACISVELCVAAQRAGYRIGEIEVGHYPRVTGAPTGLRPRVVLKGLRELYELRRHYGGPRRGS
jgi:glycosyltransferase involved in cell wall biosynthesis